MATLESHSSCGCNVGPMLVSRQAYGRSRWRRSVATHEYSSGDGVAAERKRDGRGLSHSWFGAL